ncbi:MAG: hypothetical protein WBA16_03010 [Nonlabens sp.]
MPLLKIFVVAVAFIAIGHSCSYAQNLHGIDISVDRNSQEHVSFNNAIRNKPRDVGFSIKRDGNQLYLSSTDPAFLKNLLRGAQDGVAIDVVSKNRYACNTTLEDTQVRGTLLSPVFSKKLFKKFDKKLKRYSTPVGTIPAALRDHELEYNILFLKNKKLVSYYVLYNLQAYPWELLDMGLYLDDIVYNNRSRDNKATIERFKTMQFVVPFEKGISIYKPQDVKPIYDSLNLTDYNIQKIDIKAYASVEGSTQGNLKLQNERAASIVSSLQSFQSASIVTSIETAENWVEFFNDLETTPYKNLAAESQSAIKKKLNGVMGAELEPVLATHRKAVIHLELNKIDLLVDKGMDELAPMLSNSLAQDDMEQARKVFYTIVDKVIEKNDPETMKNLEIPQQVSTVDLNNTKQALKFMFDKRQALIVANALTALLKTDPGNKRLHYNLTVMNFTLLRGKAGGITFKSLEKQIKELKKYGVSNEHVNRFLINLNILKAREYKNKRDLKKMDQAVAFILKSYDQSDLSDADYVSLAQYLSYFNAPEKAEDLLAGKARELTATQDILYYYLNLTIIDRTRTELPQYRTIMLNALDKNKSRFCNMFTPPASDGITFQLLEDEYLRKTYCEVCTD